MLKIAHIINPVKVGENSDLFFAQPITFESIKIAQAFSSKGLYEVNVFTTQFEEDRSIIPEGFIQLSNLQKSVLDVNPTLKGKKLPLIGSIMEKLNEIEAADFVIYTNMDIALMPYFYDTVVGYLEQGYDALVINRRRISSKYQSVAELPLMYADMGKSHPGFDCFVVKTSLLDRFVWGEICVGISFLEATFVHNIFAHASKPLYIPDAHLTFHLGMDVLVPRKKNPYYWHNRNEFFTKIQPELQAHFDLKKFPYGSLPFPQRALKWILNPSIFTRNYLELEGKNWRQQIKYRLDELRWRILQK